MAFSGSILLAGVITDGRGTLILNQRSGRLLEKQRNVVEACVIGYGKQRRRAYKFVRAVFEVSPV